MMFQGTRFPYQRERRVEMKVYLAGGMSWNNDWRNPIIGKYYNYIEFLDPRNSGSGDEKVYTEYDLKCIRDCDVVFAYMAKNNPSGYGLSVELGCAYALDKFIIFVDCSDVNRKKYFGMHRVMADVVFTDLNDGMKYLGTLYEYRKRNIK